MTDIVLALVMLAAFALVGGAYAMWKRTGETKQPVLMLVLAAIAVANVLIWTVPNADGTAPIDQAK
jgi:drug/metabolite transporter superfamily protein YnfA